MFQSKTVMTELQQVEDVLKHSMDRVNVIEEKLAKQLMSQTHRTLCELELKELKAVLKKNEDKLKNLRYENTRTFMVTACSVFISFLLFGIYNMFFKDK